MAPGDVFSRRRGGVLLIAAIFFAVALIAGLQGIPQFTSPDPSAGGAAVPNPLPPMASDGPLSELPPPGDNLLLRIIALVIASLVGLAILVLVIRMLIRLIRSLWRSRPLARMEGTAPDVGGAIGAAAEETLDAPEVRRGIAGALHLIDERPLPADAIIAAWVGLEDSAERAGQRRGIAETPAEFTVRVMSLHPEGSSALRGLPRLYERVRFGGYRATEADRAAARAFLRAIEEEWE